MSDQPMTRREAKERRLQEEDLPDVQAVINEVRQARENRESDEDDPNPPTTILNTGDLPILSMAEFYRDNPQIESSLPEPVHTDLLIAAEHQGDAAYQDIYPPLEEAELEPSLPHQGDDLYTTMEHDFTPPREPDTHQSLIEEDASFTTAGRVHARRVRDEQEEATSQHQWPWSRDAIVHIDSRTDEERAAEEAADNQKSPWEMTGTGELVVGGAKANAASAVRDVIARLGGRRNGKTTEALEDHEAAVAAVEAALHGTHPTWTPDEADVPAVKSQAYLAAQREAAQEPQKPPRKNPFLERRKLPRAASTATATSASTATSKLKTPGSPTTSTPEYQAEARKSGVLLVRDPHTVSTTFMAQILLYIGAVLMTALAIYGATGVMMQAIDGSGTARNLVYAIAPAAIAIVFAIGALALQTAKEDSRD